MSMSTHVIGIKPPNDKWKAMQKIHALCVEQGIETPDEVDKFFNYMEPDPGGVRVDINSQEWGYDNSAGLEIKVKDIPKNVEIIRFYNSY